ncbi:hypothetical protein DM872_25390 [Pseudomonas taiwanensis]|uniref:DUF6901 family protein n=1 Tax=Pseudomonas taiwanensis TaxID=470150 RepID=UPI0015BE0FF0|nr:hypothetical protein [Pseudomonas taiwanensis]NWL80190.1 hypothetical protein [Pseudomonas taiwanensis]
MGLEPRAEAQVRYEFGFPDGRLWVHEVDLAGQGASSDDLPDWARLGFRQCSHCPLSVTEVHHCPFARALARPVAVLAHSPSYEEVRVAVFWRGREIRQQTTLQRALGSLLGLLGATSGCPHTRMLRAMAWFHWPFSNSAETLYRALGTYLLGQHLRRQRGLEPDWDMDGLREQYRNLRLVNLGMAGRLRAAAEEDSSLNGLILLDLLAADTLYSLDSYEGELDGFFAEYFEEG